MEKNSNPFYQMGQQNSQLSRLPSRERYFRDPLFRVLVDQLYYMLTELNLTPTEIREAAMLAAIKFEETHVRSLFICDLPTLFGENTCDKSTQTAQSALVTQDSVQLPTLFTTTTEQSCTNLDEYSVTESIQTTKQNTQGS